MCLYVRVHPYKYMITTQNYQTLLSSNNFDFDIVFLYNYFFLEPSAALIYHVGHKFHEVFQLKQGRYADIPAAKLTEMMKSNSLDVSHPILMLVNGHTWAGFRIFFLCFYFILCFFKALKHLLFFFQNAPTQSLLSVVNGILDESVERKNEEIPHVWQ